MAKWANYGISTVRQNTAHRYISRARIHQDNDGTFGPATEHERTAIVKAIKERAAFITIPQADMQCSKGQRAYIIKVNGIEYIKTADNRQACGNLENLPEF